MTSLKRVRGQLFQPRPPATERLRSNRRTRALLQQNETLMRELRHRIGNSLQIIASILALDAKKVKCEEARLHLEMAHQRILAVATLEQQLESSRGGADVELAAYLRRLAENLGAAVVGDAARIAIDVRADASTVSSDVAMHMGLIVIELVINAVKHAFPGETAAGVIELTYRVEGDGWRLTVSDNGVDQSNGARHATATGLGTGIVAAIVGHLDGRVETRTGLNGSGTSVSITGRIASPKHSTKEKLAFSGTGILRLPKEVICPPH